MSRTTSGVFGAVLAFAHASMVAMGDTMHDNEIDFSGAVNIGWVETAHSITTGQPYEKGAANGATLIIRAGRHESSGPAEAFYDGLAWDERVMGLGQHIDEKPEQLNFASFGTLSATFGSGETRTCDDIRIAQGHRGMANNWWLASKNCFKAGDQFVCEKCGISFQKGQNDHEFILHQERAAVSKAHYGDPANGCLSDEQALSLHGGDGTVWQAGVCSKSTCSSDMDCSSDVPNGATAKPACVTTPQGSRRCALLCTPWLGMCGKGTCTSMAGTGVCAYDRDMATTQTEKVAALVV